GKTTIISRFLNKTENPKSTIALEYTYARQSRNTALCKDVCHIWELGAGTLLTKLLEIPITLDTINLLSIVLVIDLSKPKEMLYALDTFLSTLRTTLDQVLIQSSELKDNLMNNVWKKIGKDHADKASIEPLPVPVLILGGKYDIFQDFDPEHKKIICKTLRFFAHKNGAALQFCSSKSENLVNKAKIVFSHLGFNNPIASQPVSQDYNKPIIIPFGADAFNQIGILLILYLNITQLILLIKRRSFSAWKNTFETHFPQVSEKTIIPDDPAKDTNFKEPMVDTLRTNKDQ
uniref:Cytoplasmic dynein 2 light intermediate chain 1 n=1 Tax=Strigamia maritima TaxID=126957 RepID=T1IPV5_STRMM